LRKRRIEPMSGILKGLLTVLLFWLVFSKYIPDVLFIGVLIILLTGIVFEVIMRGNKK